jgi:serine/threonine-protein kinase
MNSSIEKLDRLKAEAMRRSEPQRQAEPQHPVSLSQLCGTGQLFRQRYQIQQILGRGGFGVTFLAEDVTLPGHPLCVIKQLCPKMSSPVALQRACQRFEREAKILSQLGSHAQIPRLLDYFQFQDEFYLIQEYVPGCTLAQQIKRQGPMDEQQVKRFLAELLPVIDYIHRNQVIHRDIKPPNLIRCQDDGRLVLIDFGAVKEQFVWEKTSLQRGSTTHFVGTLGFAPPEQLALRSTYSSDIFAIGVTCLYLLTAKPPMEFDYDVVTGEVCWQAFVQVSDHFAKVLDKMLRIAPKERYQSAQELLRVLELEPYLDHLSGCLSAQPPRFPEVEPIPDGYLSPIARTAIAIRRWQARRKLKQQLNSKRDDQQERLP